MKHFLKLSIALAAAFMLGGCAGVSIKFVDASSAEEASAQGYIMPEVLAGATALSVDLKANIPSVDCPIGYICDGRYTASVASGAYADGYNPTQTYLESEQAIRIDVDPIYRRRPPTFVKKIEAYGGY